MTPEPQEIGHPIRFPNGIIGLIKKGCWHIPEVMGASVMALIGMGLAYAGARNYYKNDGDNREFKHTYYIVRYEDPRSCIIKNPVYTEFRG